MDAMPNPHPCVKTTIELIYKTFDGVTREGGVSWSESVAIDDYGSEEECAEARLEDTESGWQELVDDEDWRHDMGVGRFNFLDAIGFRYYLPPTMVRCLLGADSESLLYQLDRPTPWLQKFASATWRNLQPAEVQSVCEFIKCMMHLEEAAVDASDPANQPAIIHGWSGVYQNFWARLDQNPI